MIDQLILIDYLFLVSKYLMYEVIELFGRNDYLHLDHYYIHKENVHDQILNDIQLSKILIKVLKLIFII